MLVTLLYPLVTWIIECFANFSFGRYEKSLHANAWNWKQFLEFYFLCVCLCFRVNNINLDLTSVPVKWVNLFIECQCNATLKEPIQLPRKKIVVTHAGGTRFFEHSPQNKTKKYRENSLVMTVMLTVYLKNKFSFTGYKQHVKKFFQRQCLPQISRVKVWSVCLSFLRPF